MTETALPCSWRAIPPAAQRVRQSNRIPSTKNALNAWAGKSSSCQTPSALGFQKPDELARTPLRFALSAEARPPWAEQAFPDPHPAVDGDTAMIVEPAAGEKVLAPEETSAQTTVGLFLRQAQRYGGRTFVRFYDAKSQCWMALTWREFRDNVLGVGTALIRWLGLVVSCSVLFLGVIWVAFDPQKQGWHDKMASTYVVIVESIEGSDQLSPQAAP